MRKKCVRWAKPVLATLAIIILFGLHRSNSTLSAQSSPNPLTLPRLSFSDFTYQGGFRLPAVAQGDDFSYGGTHMAYNPARNSLFVSSLHHKVAEVTIPSPANTNVITQMPFASYLQGFFDPTEGRLQQMSPNNSGVLLGGLLVQGNKLYGSGYLYYDGVNAQRVSHFSHSTNLSESSFVGLSQVWDTARSGFVGGYMVNLPAEWQSVLGGPSLTGQCCIPVISRTSYGPAAFAFDPTNIGGNAAVAATPLLYYPADHTTLGPYEGANQNFGAATMMGGAAVIAGTRTALFIGRIGTGAYCYGEGVNDPALNGTRAADGVMRCYDPTNAAKGPHGYPYRYQMWAYDLADFATVKAGAKQPWDVVPYAVWPFELPTPEQTVQIGGVAYDAQHQLLYISQMFADLDGCCERRAVIHTLKINIGSSTTSAQLTTAVSSTPAAPASIPVSSVALTTNLTSPQPAGSNIVWTATPTTSDSGALVYKWFVTNDGGTWSAVGGWTSSNQYSWTPTAANPNYRVSAWVKHASNAADAAEASADKGFPITDPPSTSTPVSSVALAANMAAPQPAGSTIVWTATQAGGTGALVYKWFVTADGGTWNAVGSWTSSNQFAWTPATASPNYAVSVWAKRATNSADAAEASTYKAFAIFQPSLPVDSVTLTTDVPAPQEVSSTIVWTAVPIGGTGPLVYKWFVSSDGGTWNAVGSWTASNQFTWTPAVPSANYAVSAWVKRASNPADAAEASTYQAFPIQDPVTGVALATNLASPQPLSSTIQFTAAPVGGTGDALLYKWSISSDDGLTWTAAGPWSASNQFTWTAMAVNPQYRVTVWVKHATNPSDYPEASTQRRFAIKK